MSSNLENLITYYSFNYSLSSSLFSNFFLAYSSSNLIVNSDLFLIGVFELFFFAELNAEFFPLQFPPLPLDGVFYTTSDFLIYLFGGSGPSSVPSLVSPYSILVI